MKLQQVFFRPDEEFLIKTQGQLITEDNVFSLGFYTDEKNALNMIVTVKLINLSHDSFRWKCK
jgi:hypothetical protein